MALSSSADIAERSSSVSATGSVPVTSRGSPTCSPMVLPRPVRSDGWSLVFSSCVPQVTIGIRGTPASAAIRTAPVLSSLISKERLIVASGKMPTISPDRAYSTASR
jgi:hypothetical protein